MLTLITDASYCASGAAGWAAWAKADGRAPEVWSGPIVKCAVADAAEAELVAAWYGFRRAVDHFPGHDVLLQSDCHRALRMLRWGLGFSERPWKGQGWPPQQPGRVVGCAPLSPTPCEAAVLALWRALLAGNPLSVAVRHVKGHAGRQAVEGRFGVNRMCDYLARSHMQQRRAVTSGSNAGVSDAG